MKRLPGLFLLAALGAALAADPAVIDKDSIKTFYRQFPRLTTEPVEVATIMTISCVGIPAPHEVRAQEKVSGPHTQHCFTTTRTTRHRRCTAPISIPSRWGA